MPAATCACMNPAAAASLVFPSQNFANLLPLPDAYVEAAELGFCPGAGTSNNMPWFELDAIACGLKRAFCASENAPSPGVNPDRDSTGEVIACWREELKPESIEVRDGSIGENVWALDSNGENMER